MLGRGWLKGAVLSLFLSSWAFAHANFDVPFSKWLKRQQHQSYLRIRKNITSCGAAMAAQSSHYQKHWVRDSALISLALTRYYEWMGPFASQTATVVFARPERLQSRRERIWTQLETKVRFSTLIQSVGHPDPEIGIGAALYSPAGEPIEEEWGQPQNDGPALRASAHLKLISAHATEETILSETVTEEDLYALAKRDAEYVASNWSKPSWDLWEEIKGKHFYTLMAQRKALVDVIRRGLQRGDKESVEQWSAQVSLIEAELRLFWDADKGYLVQTRDFVADHAREYKKSNLDVATVLAVLHTHDPSDPFFGVLDPQILATVVALENTFTPLYPINGRPGPEETVSEGVRAVELGPGIGRYVEDHWNGFSRGETAHPWFLATAGFAEYYFLAAATLHSHPERLEEIKETEFFKRLGCAPNVESAVQALLRKGDSFLQRVRLHGTEKGELAEQFDRDSGYQTGPVDLTWSHAAFLTASIVRYELEALVQN
ncbi:MAG: glycoside hydrolase family 15 protein [Bdellovibrionota bacterium]